MTLILTPDTEEKLHRYAETHGCDPNAVGNSLLARAIEQADTEFEETMAGIDAGWRAGEEGRERPFREYIEDVRAGRKEARNAAV
jgi:hypothetical protein